MNSTRFPTTIKEVVKDMISDIPESVKAEIVSTTEDDLIHSHHGLSTYIRNTYGLWENQNPQLLKATGEDHPDDASMVILKAVREALLGTGETYHKGTIEETDTLIWNVFSECLEIPADGRSLIIGGISVEVARELANALRLQFREIELAVYDDARPQPVLRGVDATVGVWMYPRHPSNRGQNTEE